MGICLNDHLFEIKESHESHRSQHIADIILECIETGKTDFECEVVAVVSGGASPCQAPKWTRSYLNMTVKHTP